MMEFDGHWLTWGRVRYEARSGPWGKGTLPAGAYEVRVKEAVVNLTASGYVGDDGVGWFIPIVGDTPGRGGFGIHPDGGVEGTLGCIGLVGEAAAEFWSRWDACPMGDRPTGLEVWQ